MFLTRRSLLGKIALANAALLSGGASNLLSSGARAQGVTVKVGALKTIPAIAQFMYDRFQADGMKVEVISFSSPTECKNAVVTRSVDFAGFGIAAAISGAAAGEPLAVIGGLCDGGMAVVARKDLGIAKLTDLRGRKVGIWPGSTQEIFIKERMKMEGMNLGDITPVRIFFSEMHTALVRGDIDAYVGAEPGPGVSVSSGAGTIVEYPYSTPMGALNVILATHPELIKEKPALVAAMLKVHRKASEFCMANKEETAKAAIQLFGMKREAVDISLPNVTLNWQLSPELIQRSRIYADHMLEMKQIRSIPDFSALMAPKFSDELAKSAT